MTSEPGTPLDSRWRAKLHEIIFESDTPAGRAFDTALIVLVIASVLAVMLESVASIRAQYGDELLLIEWFFTILFTIEYGLRLLAVRRPILYATSFFGLIDLIAIVPTYLSILVPGAHSLLIIRSFRLLRVFRIFKLGTYLGEAQLLLSALKASRPKVTVFLLGVGAVVLTTGTLMYLIEGEANGFTSIPMGIYWAIVTMTTVGFGDITPKTVAGQTLASMIMIVGYGVIAVPTGIVTSEMVRVATGRKVNSISNQACPNCSAEGHDSDAVHCKYCGAKL